MNIWDIKASKVMKKAAGSKASQKMKKPAGTLASRMKQQASRQMAKEKVKSFCTDSESEQEQFKHGYVGGWNYIGVQGGFWATDDPKVPGQHRRFFQIAPAVMAGRRSD